MGFFDHFESQNEQVRYYHLVSGTLTQCTIQVNEAGHKASLSHELIAGAAAFEAAKAYEKHCAENGKPDSHA